MTDKTAIYLPRQKSSKKNLALLAKFDILIHKMASAMDAPLTVIFPNIFTKKGTSWRFSQRGLKTRDTLLVTEVFKQVDRLTRFTKTVNHIVYLMVTGYGGKAI